MISGRDELRCFRNQDTKVVGAHKLRATRLFTLTPENLLFSSINMIGCYYIIFPTTKMPPGRPLTKVTVYHKIAALICYTVDVRHMSAIAP